jgi:hypothetical protein
MPRSALILDPARPERSSPRSPTAGREVLLDGLVQKDQIRPVPAGVVPSRRSSSLSIRSCPGTSFGRHWPRPGSGKSTLLKQLVSSAASTRQHRFYFDLNLKGREEDTEEYVTRTLASCIHVDRYNVFDVFHYLIGSISATLFPALLR